MKKFARFVHKLSSISANIATVMLLGVFVVSCIDILGTKFKHPIVDAVELTGYLQYVLIPAGAALVLFAGQHVRVEAFTDKLPKRVKQIIDGMVSLVSLVLFVIIAWQFFKFGIAKNIRNEYSPGMHFPFYYVIYLSAIAFIPLCLANFVEFYTNIFNKEVINK